MLQYLLPHPPCPIETLYTTWCPSHESTLHAGSTLSIQLAHLITDCFTKKPSATLLLIPQYSRLSFSSTMMATTITSSEQSLSIIIATVVAHVWNQAHFHDSLQNPFSKHKFRVAILP
jgi:hypothetical protein